MLPCIFECEAAASREVLHRGGDFAWLRTRRAVRCDDAPLARNSKVELVGDGEHIDRAHWLTVAIVSAVVSPRVTIGGAQVLVR